MKDRKYKKSLFIFRRDLRLHDNTGLIQALKSSETVIPAFIFTPEQIEKNSYRSDACLQFMLESLHDLREQLEKKGGKLFLFFGKVEEVVAECIDKLSIDALFVNQDYTPYSQKRDQKIHTLCKEKDVAFFSFHDALLHPPEETLKADGKPYTVFTPYYRNALKLQVAEPQSNSATHYFQGSIPFAEKANFLDTLHPSFATAAVRGGRKEALALLKNISAFQKYSAERDFPSLNATTHLSAYLKFNVCSIREVYAAICETLSPHHELLRSLYWRDFFTAIAFFFPHVFGHAFHSKYEDIQWHTDRKRFKAWCEGETGFPIVDAGMRELNATGFMHNRLRMITGSFLVKDLLIDWRLGEKYFAQKLIDYDPAVNNGNWQWVASTGCDAQPYFRIFNPWNQQKKFDPEAIYIKRWIPELKKVPPKIIHQWDEKSDLSLAPHYLSPIVEHGVQAKSALKLYRS